MLVYVKYNGETYFARRTTDDNTYTVTLPRGTPFPEPMLPRKRSKNNIPTKNDGRPITEEKYGNTLNSLSRLYIRSPNTDFDDPPFAEVFKDSTEPTFLYVYTGHLLMNGNPVNPEISVDQYEDNDGVWILKNVRTLVRELLVNKDRGGQYPYLYRRFITIKVDNTKPYQESKPRNVYVKLDGKTYGSGLKIEGKIEKYLISLPPDIFAERLSDLELFVDLPPAATISPPVPLANFSDGNPQKYVITAQDEKTTTTIEVKVQVLSSDLVSSGDSGGGGGGDDGGGGGGCDAGLAGIAALALALILLRPTPRRRSE
jgi:hypothetical protein